MGAVILADVTIPGEAFVLIMGALCTIGIGITSWALVLLVRTSNVLAVLEAKHEALSARVDAHDDLLASHPEIRRG